MPLENVKLIPIKCPNCGADLEVPSSLDVAQCKFCGSKFFISEQKTASKKDSSDVVENYIKLAVDDMKRGNDARGRQYLDKAREVSIELTEEVMKKYASQLFEAYYNVFIEKVNEFRELEPIYDNFPFNIVNLPIIETKWDEAQRAFEDALRFNARSADLYYWKGMAYVHWGKKIYSFWKRKEVHLYLDAAKASFKSALEIDPNHKGAREWLTFLGGT